MSITRRTFITYLGAGGAGALVFGSRMLGVFGGPGASAATLGPGLSDPTAQPKFANPVPNALDPGFVFDTRNGKISIDVQQAVQHTGLVGPDGVTPVPTTVWGYGDKNFNTWPGRTIQVRSNEPLEVKWQNKLVDASGTPLPFLLTGKDNTSIGLGDYTGRSVVDESLHWAYSLMHPVDYTQYSIAANGVPIVPHVHGGHTDAIFDGNPEYFFSPGYAVRGPRWVEKKYLYDNSQPAGTVWYHDHALGITRLNVYAGMAGFYIIRDDDDTGLPGNPLGLPAFPYEAAFAIQDKMFKANGELFYPAFPGDPFYDDFIIGEEAILPPEKFPGGGPTGLAEFFGDHMVVNGVIWPQMDVERRNYRLRLLNGCDSRFLVTQFVEVPPGATDFTDASEPLSFTVIGSDQGLTSTPTAVDTLVMETGSRYDVIIDFKQVTPGNRVIMKNIGGDSPFGFTFGDDLDPDDVFPDRQTDRIMAFDVVLPVDPAVPDLAPTGFADYADSRGAAYGNYGVSEMTIDRIRKVALFEGTDEFGRLQPILGTAEPATDYLGNPINWPNEPAYVDNGLVGQMDGAVAWHSPTTENPGLGDVEEWHVANVTGDAHPVHLHLVHFEVIGRSNIAWDSATTDDDRVLDPAGVATPAPNGDGTYLVAQPVVQHSGAIGNGFRIANLTEGAPATAGPEYVDADLPKDMVAALPSQITKIRAKFDKPGRYVWHCHILSHEDHEMMRALHVGPGA